MSEPNDISLDQTMPDQTGSQSSAEIARIYQPGDIVGGTYRLKELIGKGGMGYVFCAEHTIIGQDYALKLLAPDQINETNWRRFQSEGKAIARLNHQNVVRIYNMGVDLDQCPFYVMDLLHGVSLAELIVKTGPVTESIAIEIFLQLCRGLSYAHKVGIIHRDIKPSNVILQNQPVKALENKDSVPLVKIVDFGLAKLIRIHGDSIQRITNTGQIFGTPLYMSPEQCMAGSVDARSDVYSLGCALYETLTGRPPFCGENAMETVLMHMEQEPLRMAQTFPQGKFSQSIELVVAKMLKKDPAQRYQTMAQVSHDLERIKRGKVVVQPLPAQELPLAALEKSNQEPAGIAVSEAETADRKGHTMPVIFAGLALLAFIGLAVCVGVHPKQHGKTANLASATVEAVANVEDLPTERDRLHKAFAGLPDFSRGLSLSHGRWLRVFQFSDEYPVGTLFWDNARGDVLAQGTVAVPANLPIELKIDCHTGYALELLPELLSKFDANDICYLSIKSDEWAKFLQQVTGWNHLSRLKLNEMVLDSQDLSSIDALSHVTWMRVEKCAFEPQDFVKLKILHRLTKLELDSKYNVDDVIEAVAGSKTIQFFSLETWPCSPRVLSYLAQCPNITELLLAGADIKDQDLLILEKLPKLQSLHLRGTKLTPHCIAYLRRLRSLKTLVLEDLHWSDSDKDRLKREIPAYQRQ
jgi:serine/threonine protein kinase